MKLTRESSAAVSGQTSSARELGFASAGEFEELRLLVSLGRRLYFVLIISLLALPLSDLLSPCRSIENSGQSIFCGSEC